MGEFAPAGFAILRLPVLRPFHVRTPRECLVEFPPRAFGTPPAVCQPLAVVLMLASPREGRQTVELLGVSNSDSAQSATPHSGPSLGP